MLSALEAAARRGCHIVSINPLHERALDRFAHPQDMVDLLTGGHRHRRAVPARADQRRRRLAQGDHEGGTRCGAAADPAGPRPCLHRRAYFGVRRVRRSALDASLLGRDRRAERRRSRALIRQAAEIYIRAERAIVCWAMGLTQHKNGVANIQEVVNLLLLRGNLGRPGAGACPVRGPQQRAGRPDDGDLRTSLGRVPRPPRPRRSASNHPASTATTWSPRSRRCTRGGPTSSSRWGATSTPPLPTPRTPPRRSGVAAYGPRLDQAEPGPSGSPAGRPSFFLAWAGPSTTSSRAGRSS